jgi:hypothetical protein
LGEYILSFISKKKRGKRKKIKQNKKAKKIEIPNIEKNTIAI